MIQYFAAAGLINALFSFLAGLYVYLQNKSGPVHRSFFIFTITVTLWSGFYAFWQVQTDKEEALLLFRLAMMPCYYIVFSFFWFVLTLVEYEYRKKVFYFCWAVPTFFLFFNFTGFGVKDVTQRLYFSFWPVPGLMIHIYLFFFCMILIVSFWVLFYVLFRSSGPKKQQIKWVTFTLLPGWLAGATNWFLWYDIPIPPIPYVFVAIALIILAYTIVRRQLFDLEAVVQAFQREKLATIGLIAASINHEIRNPLYAVKSLLEVHLGDLDEGRSAKTPREVSERALKQVTRALDVITKLNRFAKPSEGVRDKGQGLSANIQEALQNVLDLIAYEFELDRIHIQNNIPKDLPNIQADQRQLEEILFNLIVNACHAMSASGKGDRSQSLADRPVPVSYEEGVAKGGTLVIAATRHCEDGQRMNRTKQSPRLLRSARNDNRVQITITDTGTGISPEHLKHLFEPFHTTKGDKGTGLGLYITKQLVERNGGKITVKTQEGKGTSFVLEFRVVFS